MKTATVKFTVNVNDSFHLYKYLNEFLRTSFREFANSHNIIDYEIKDDKENTNNSS